LTYLSYIVRSIVTRGWLTCNTECILPVGVLQLVPAAPIYIPAASEYLVKYSATDCSAHFGTAEKSTATTRGYGSDWFPGCNSNLNAMIALGILATAGINRRWLQKGAFLQGSAMAVLCIFRGSEGLLQSIYSFPPTWDITKV